MGSMADRISLCEIGDCRIHFLSRIGLHTSTNIHAEPALLMARSRAEITYGDESCQQMRSVSGRATMSASRRMHTGGYSR